MYEPMMPVYWLGRALCSMAIHLSGGYNVEGLKYVPRSGYGIIACNHVSLLDPPLVGTSVTFRQVRFLAKKDLCSTPVIGWLIAKLGCVWVDRQAKDGKALIEAEKHLDDGRLLGIFPEGTRSKDGKLKKGRSGAAVLALKSGAPVIPAAVFSTRECGKRYCLPGRPKVSIRYGEPFSFEKDPEPSLMKIRDARDLIMKKIAELQELGPVK